MLGDISVAANIYIITGYTDMRKSVDGLCLYQCRKPVHSRTQVCVSTDDIDCFKAGGIIQHAAPP